MYKQKSFQYRNFEMMRLKIWLLILGLTVIQAKAYVDVSSTVMYVVEWTIQEESFEDITLKLSEIEENTNTNTIIKMLQNLPKRIRLELRLNEMIKYQDLINTIYNKMERHIMQWDTINNITLQNFCQSIISDQTGSVSYMVEILYSYLVPSEKGITNTGIQNIMANLPEETNIEMMHKLHQSPQQILYSLYKSIALTQIKGYVLMQFAYKTLEKLGMGKFETEAAISSFVYKKNMINIARVFKSATDNASKEFWMNDPEKHIKGETYDDIVGLAQATIFHLKNLNSGHTCFSTCESHKYKVIKDRRNQTCSKVVNCRTMAWDVQLCHAQKNSTRKYDFVKNGGQDLGDLSKKCSKPQTLKGWVEAFNGWDCPYCMCTYLEPPVMGNRAIYINLREALSNIDENRVVTGVRFIKHNNIIHLQIQEGELLPYGNVKDSQWQPVENYKITDKRKVHERQNYHKLTWNSRSLDLEDLRAPDGYIITGVRFKKIQKHLKLEIRVTPVDYKMGKLIEEPKRSYYISNNVTSTNNLKLYQPDIPVKSKDKSEPDSEQNQFITFNTTDFKKDFAQTIVPYFDCQPVESQIPTPLQGIGIFHKGRKGYGGFIAPKIITYDVGSNLQVDFDD